VPAIESLQQDYTGRRGGYSSATNKVPFSTAAPGATSTLFTLPGAVARSSFSIFIASITTTPCPASTISPTCTLTRTMRPGIGARTGAGPVGGALAAVVSRIARVRSSRASVSNRYPSTHNVYLPRPSLFCATIHVRADLHHADGASLDVRQLGVDAGLPFVADSIRIERHRLSLVVELDDVLHRAASPLTGRSSQTVST